MLSKDSQEARWAELCARSEEKYEDKDCAVKALAVVCDVSYNKAHQIMTSNGRRRNKGTPLWVTQRSIRDLGYECHLLPEDHPLYKQKTIKSLEKKLLYNSRHTYLIRTAKHILAATGGRVIDWTGGRLHRVQQIFEVVKKDLDSD